MEPMKKQPMRKLQSPEYKRAKRAWRVMKRRCLEKGFKDWPRYGGAGILIAPQWVESFGQFLADIGLPPTASHWLGRLDTAAHYVPGNVVWTLQTPQMSRRQFCRKVVVKGQFMTAAQAQRVLGSPTRNSILDRWHAGYSLEQPILERVPQQARRITWQGQDKPLGQWALLLGLTYRTLYQRLKRGMPLEKAMTQHRYASNGNPKPNTRKTQS